MSKVNDGSKPAGTGMDDEINETTNKNRHDDTNPNHGTKMTEKDGEMNDKKRPRSPTASQAPVEESSDEKRKWSPEERNDVVKQMMEALVEDYNPELDKVADNKDLMEFFVNLDGRCLNGASDRIKDEKSVVEKAMEENPSSLRFASERLRGDADLVQRAVELSKGRYFDRFSFEYAADHLKDDKSFVTRVVVKAPGRNFQYCSERLRDDPELVLASMEPATGEHRYKDGSMLRFASHCLRNDKDFVRRAVKHHFDAAFYMDHNLLHSDQDFLVEILLLATDIHDLEYQDEEYCPNSLISLVTNRDLALQLVRRSPSLLRVFPDTFKADSEIAFEALKACGCNPDDSRELDHQLYNVFRGITDELKQNREFVLESVKLSWHNLANVHEDFWMDIEVVELAVKDPAFKLFTFGADWSEHRFIAKQAVKYKDLSELWLADELRADRDIMLEAVRFNGINLERVTSADLQADRELVFEAVRQNGNALQFASAPLRESQEIVMEAVRQNGNALEFASTELRESREIVMAAMRSHSEAFRFARGPPCQDPEILGIVLHTAPTLDPLQTAKQQILIAVSAIQKQHDLEGGDVPASFRDGSNQSTGFSVQQYVKSWKRFLHHKIWLVQQQVQCPLDSGIVHCVFEHYDIREEFQIANEVLRWAPVFAALANRGINWDGIPLALNR